uniref:hypothetical protein n=1 Tax=Kitasatospora sp. NBC_01519 TaxID=2903576 RepID=UPI002F911792
MAPLALTPVMRSRLRTAVRALLAEPGLAEQPDAVRLGAVVLMARTPWTSGLVEIRKSELGRWLGVSAERMKAVARSMRASGAVLSQTKEGSHGEHQAMECRVVPMWEARGVAGHPLALAKKELAVLLRVIEELFAPGWAHRDGSVFPPGLLARRTGRGAATDRLAALLLVLDANERGWVRLCGGRTGTEAGRPAVTLARMLGCTPAGAAQVLRRLAEAGVVKRLRRGASGLRSRSRLVLPSVAAAHQAGLVAPARREVTRNIAGESVSDLDAAPPLGEAAVSEETMQVNEVVEADEAGVPDLDAATPLHASHSLVAGVPNELTVAFGISGEAAMGVTHHRPERTHARKGCADNSEHRQTVAESDVGENAGSPRRGEEPESNVIRDTQEKTPGQVTRPGCRLPRIPRPPLDLARVLAPVACLWGHLDRRWARNRITAAVRVELGRIAGWTGHDGAFQALAERLERRLKAQGGIGRVTDPVGWLLGKGLPQRQECAHGGCDDGIRMDTGTECVTCRMRLADRCSVRRVLIQEATAGLAAGTPDDQRRAVVDAHLRQHALRRAAEQVAARERTEQQDRHADISTLSAVADKLTYALTQALEADEQAEQVHETVMRRVHGHPTRAAALAATDQAAGNTLTTTLRWCWSEALTDHERERFGTVRGNTGTRSAEHGQVVPEVRQSLDSAPPQCHPLIGNSAYRDLRRQMREQAQIREAARWHERERREQLLRTSYNKLREPEPKVLPSVDELAQAAEARIRRMHESHRQALAAARAARCEARTVSP